MQKIILLLAGITQICLNSYGESFKFKDGTRIGGEILSEGPGKPDEYGIVLLVDKKIYIHHYPYHKEALSPPLHHYGGTNNEPKNLKCCTPSRISFYHFDKQTLISVNRKLDKSMPPGGPKNKTLEAIHSAMYSNAPEFMLDPDTEKTFKWKFQVLFAYGGHITRQEVVWGRDYYPLPSSFEKENSVNDSAPLPIKRR